MPQCGEVLDLAQEEKPKKSLEVADGAGFVGFTGNRRFGIDRPGYGCFCARFGTEADQDQHDLNQEAGGIVIRPVRRVELAGDGGDLTWCQPPGSGVVVVGGAIWRAGSPLRDE